MDSEKLYIYVKIGPIHFPSNQTLEKLLDFISVSDEEFVFDIEP